MADRIAILGDEPYAEWVKRDGTAQRLFKAYRDKWPDGTAKCVAIGGEFYVRFQNGEIRHVDTAADFDYESEWCAQCGDPIDSEGGEYYCCDVYGCDAVLCEDCGGAGNSYYCPRHRGNELFSRGKECECTYPYAHEHNGQFTFGVEVEIESELDDDFAENVKDSDIIAGWDKDPSLESNGIELQTNILDMSKLPALRELIKGIPYYGENAGGHIHVSRTANQCASRWYWALRGLDASQCERLNMRHMGDDYWCGLNHGEYTGKHTAVNDEHRDTIELRTFDCWYEDSAGKLVPAIRWIRAMWRFFEKHPRGTVKANVIEQYSSCMADNVTDTPHLTLDERLAAARRVKAARKAEDKRKCQERAIEIRRNVEKNVEASRRARASHGNTRTALHEWNYNQNQREYRRETIDRCLSNATTAYAFPSRDLRPLHIYLAMATVRIVEKGKTFRSLEHFSIYHAANSATIWDGCEYGNRHGDTAQRVLENILRNRVALASHGKPTTEPLERTALRLYKRVGRPELSARYVRIRKNVANAE
jgi:hypothetical protein